LDHNNVAMLHHTDRYTGTFARAGTKLQRFRDLCSRTVLNLWSRHNNKSWNIVGIFWAVELDFK
jgi:hypothetical protein